MIYANPSDAALLVREKGFVGVARPCGLSDEAVVVVPSDSPAQRVEDLAPNIRVAATDHPDVKMMGMIMLEPANIGRDNRRSRRLRHVRAGGEGADDRPGRRRASSSRPASTSCRRSSARACGRW